MTPEEILSALTARYSGVRVTAASGDSFVLYDPGNDLPPERQMPLATIVTSDNDWDSVSDLNRTGVFRLNVGASRDSYRTLFGPQPPTSRDGQPTVTGFDFTALDTLLPHPTYASMSWICIVSPTAATFETLWPYLDESYDQAVARYDKAMRRQGDGEGSTAT